MIVQSTIHRDLLYVWSDDNRVGLAGAARLADLAQTAHVPALGSGLQETKHMTQMASQGRRTTTQGSGSKT